MRQIRGTITDFIAQRQICIFCQRPLTQVLTNSIGHPDQRILPDLYVTLKDQRFQFRLKYDGDWTSFDVSATIHLDDNRFSYYYNSSPTTCNGMEIINTFIGMKPCIELLCDNQECKMHYTVQSDSLQIDPNTYVRPISPWLESFLLNDWYVCNLQDLTETFIYSHSHPNTSAIQCPRLHFEDYSREKLFNRISTIVNFS